MSESTKFLMLFKSNLTDFMDEMVELFNQPEFIIFRVMINSVPTEQVISPFIKCVLPNKDRVVVKEVEVCRDIAKACDPKVGSSIDLIYNILKDPAIDHSTKDTIWSWFAQFILICEKYVSAREKELTC